MDFVVGDIVSRDGTDRQRVVSVHCGGKAIRVVCIKPSVEGWCEVGDVEFNLSRRYEKVEEQT